MPYNLNTSHVLIYLDTSSDVAAEVFYLNTSHVLIYPKGAWHIHLVIKFKYISCSYLSLLHLKFQ